MLDRAPIAGSAASLWPSEPAARVNQNREPCPTSLSTPMSPPIRCTSSLTIDSPSPVPPRERVIDASAW